MKLLIRENRAFVSSVYFPNNESQIYLIARLLITDECWKGLEGNEFGLIQVLSQHLRGGTEENHKKYHPW
jgi:hypothetical protein